MGSPGSDRHDLEITLSGSKVISELHGTTLNAFEGHNQGHY